MAVLWEGQLSREDKLAISQRRSVNYRQSAKTQIAATAAITWAEQHLFDRRSVVNEFELWRHALEHGRGQDFSLKHVQLLTKRRPYVRNEALANKVTTRSTLEREKAIVALAQSDQGRYAVTSYAAQGKTADYVIFSDSAIKAATNQKQWYVTISRGRKGIEIFTRDKHELRENVVRSGNRELAMELSGENAVVSRKQSRSSRRGRSVSR